eukprot:UN17129
MKFRSPRGNYPYLHYFCPKSHLKNPQFVIPKCSKKLQK